MFKNALQLSTGVLLLGLVLSLAGCGDTAGQRAVSGGLIGAGVGAGAGALTTPSHPRYGY
jgi:hypothetical protein